MTVRALSISLLLGLGALGVALLGLSVPIHFRAVSPLILEEAAAGTPRLAELADDFLLAGHPGPVGLLAKFDPSLLESPERKARWEGLFAANPSYRYSGGSAPYFEVFLNRIQLPETTSGAAVLPLMLPRDHRAKLLQFLQRSNNATVAALLETRQLSGFQRFLPAYSEAGHPLDAAILTTALLEQSGAWTPDVSRSLRTALREAIAPEGNLAPLERIYLAVLTLSTRCDWTQLTALLGAVPDAQALDQLAAATHQTAGDFPTLYGAILLSRDAPGVLRYLETQPDDGWPVLRFALGLGKGALHELATFNQTLYQPPAWLAKLPLDGAQQALRGFTQRQPRLAFALKLAALVLSGYLFALALARLARRVFEREFDRQQDPRLEHLIHGVTATALATLVWILAEPRLLEFAPNAGRELRLDLAQILPEPNLNYAATLSAMNDQITLIVLLMFFVMQLVVFTFSLLKLKEIRSQPVPAKTKIKVLDNEEILFDLGLYVGIGGTVLSLILIVLGIVEAIQMAAFSSTLFGIIFVALLKVFFVRPYRRRLIMEAAQDANPTTA